MGFMSCGAALVFIALARLLALADKTNVAETSESSQPGCDEEAHVDVCDIQDGLDAEGLDVEGIVLIQKAAKFMISQTPGGSRKHEAEKPIKPRHLTQSSRKIDLLEKIPAPAHLTNLHEPIVKYVSRDNPTHSSSTPVILALRSSSNRTHERLIARQPANVGSVTESVHQNWFSRLGDALTTVIIGIVLIIFSIPCMWVNERRSARFENLINLGQNECLTVACDKLNPSHRGCLVHVQGANAEGKKPLKDDRFPSFQFESKCLRISSTVEAYQWVQNEKQEKRRDNLGGGETTITTYTYKKEWKSEKIDSSCFKQRGHENRLAKTNMDLGTYTKTCTLVHFGAFQLPQDMVSQLSNFQDGSPILGVKAEDFTKSEEDYYYYYPAKRSGEPQVGDMRATCKYIPDGPATAVGLQAEDPKLERDSFLPYRLVSRGFCCCAVGEEQLKALQIQEGQKTADDLYADDKCSCGPLNFCFYCCLSVCNLVTYCFSGLSPPQIYHLFPGDLAASACWKRITFQADAQKWILRAVSWLMMLIGFNMLFEPFFTIIDIVPLLGPYLSSFLAGAVFVVSLIFTLAIATLVISIAYIVYHPLLGILYLVMSAACITVPALIIQATKQS